MALSINTNIASLTAQRNVNNNQSALQTSLSRLSSGLRINSAKDDAAGLAISERFGTQIRGSNVAARNANDAISLTQTAEGALGEISNNLQRIRELAVQSRNATNSTADRKLLDAEAQQLKSEIDRISSTANFNGVKLLDGSFTAQEFQIGANTGDRITVDSILDADSTSLGTYDRADVTGAAATAFTAITAGHIQITVGANTYNVGDIAAAGNATERADGLMNAINAIAQQSGVYAVKDTATTVSLVSNGAFTIGFGGASATTATTGLTAGAATVTSQTGFAALDLSTVAGADTAMNAMDAALSAVSGARAKMGAIQNRFASVISNLQSTSENLESARSRIRDADFASETANLTRNQILQQAGTAMLAQANSMPNMVLSLLGR
ncbi:flagellin [Imbroritus primus]|uniref:Flagellin n=1 Tax=Imbroritus primus TaxID=3058603 RepID=A0ACD3STM7_9BURK|nr:flagellin [Burkholderiaceae bacterium PBA]